MGDLRRITFAGNSSDIPETYTKEQVDRLIAVEAGDRDAADIEINERINNIMAHGGSEVVQTIWERSEDDPDQTKGFVMNLSRGVSNFDFIDIYAENGQFERIQSTQGWFNISTPDVATTGSAPVMGIFYKELTVTENTITIDESVHWEWDGSFSYVPTIRTSSIPDIVRVCGVKYELPVELTDIRVGANGITYPTAGDAVRGQYTELKEDLSETATLQIGGFLNAAPNGKKIQGLASAMIVYAKCFPNKKYTVSKINTSRFSVFFTESAPFTSTSVEQILNEGYVSDWDAESITTTAPENAGYICTYVFNNETEHTKTEVFDSVVITTLEALDITARNEARKTAAILENNIDYINPFAPYYPLFEQKGYSRGNYVAQDNRISITEPFTVTDPIYVKALDGYRFTPPIWDTTVNPPVMKKSSGWRTETVLTPGMYYTFTISKTDDSDLTPDEAVNVLGNIFSQEDLWNRLSDGKRVYKGEYVQATVVVDDTNGAYIDIGTATTNRVVISKPLYVKAGSAIRIIPGENQGFFGARFKNYDGTYLTDQIDSATTRYTEYFWNIDEDSYLYVVFRKSSSGAFLPSELTGRIELYQDFAYMNDRYGVIKDIFDAEMFTTLSSVKELLTEPCLVFPLVTDIHAESTVRSLFSNFDQMIDNIYNLSRYIHCDFLLNLGDNTDGDTVPLTLRRNDYMLSRFMHIGIPYYQAIGNHDTNYTSRTGSTGNTKLTIEETYRSYISATKDVICNPDNFTDYYVDFEWCDVRLVVLNNNYLNAYAYHSSTAEWLASEALNTDKIVLLAEHLSSISSQNWNNNNPANSGAITSALQSFVDGGGTLIQVCGHSHADYSFETPWLTVFSNCQKFEKADLSGAGYQAITGYDSLGIVAPDRVAGTATEDSWSVVVLRPKSRKINFVRFGAGNDREYSF